MNDTAYTGTRDPINAPCNQPQPATDRPWQLWQLIDKFTTETAACAAIEVLCGLNQRDDYKVVAPATDDRREQEMKAMNDRWQRLHKVLGTQPDDDWDEAPFQYIERLQFPEPTGYKPPETATFLWDEAYVDERLGRDASWPQIIEAANYSINAALAAEKEFYRNNYSDLYEEQLGTWHT